MKKKTVVATIERPYSPKGITLIALIITIIIMLILAGVTIAITINGGLFGQAETAKEKMIEEQGREEIYITLGEMQSVERGNLTLQKVKSEIMNYTDRIVEVGEIDEGVTPSELEVEHINRICLYNKWKFRSRKWWTIKRRKANIKFKYKYRSRRRRTSGYNSKL
jgi:Tfp pilus assembly protein PilE